VPIKITQTVSEPAAELSYQRLAGELNCPPSRILERLLLALPSDDLLALVEGRRSMAATKTISLDAESLLAIRSAVADSIPLFGGRVEDAARVGARQGAREAIDSTLDRDI
jgi:hypothetical protein